MNQLETTLENWNWQQVLGPLHWLPIQVSIEFVEDHVFPPFAGAAFRGVFGHALRFLCCSTFRQSCDHCAEIPDCAYHYVFESPVPAELSHRPLFRGLRQGPQPFVLQPPLLERPEVRSWDAAEVGVVLLGNAVPLARQVVDAVAAMGLKGFFPNSGRFQITKVTPEPWPLQANAVRTGSQLLADAANLGNISEATVRFLTPTLIQADGELHQALPFQLIVRAMLRRMSMILALHCGAPLEQMVQPLLDLAAHVRCIGGEISPAHVRRHSNRQERGIEQEGIIGAARYAGPLTPFWPLLLVAREINIGKASTFGWGRIALEV